MGDLESGGAWRDDASITRRVLSRLKPGSTRRRLQCQEMVQLVTVYLEDALDDAMRTRFEQHLQQCDGCSEFLEQMRVTVQTVGAIREDEIDPIFLSRLLEAFDGTAGSW